MQHCPARAAQRLAAAVLALVLLLCAFLPRAHAAELKEKNGIRLLSFDTSHILSIGNQTSGKCSLYALRYARTILDGKVCSGSGMWSNGAVWSAAGYTGYAGTRAECLKKLYNELAAGRPVIVHLKNTTVSGVKRHANRTSTYEYHLTSSGWDAVNYPHIATSSTYGHWVCVAGISSTPACWTIPYGWKILPSKCWGEIRSQSPPARRAFFCLDHDKCRLSFTTLPVKMRLERSAERDKREI